MACQIIESPKFGRTLVHCDSGPRKRCSGCGQECDLLCDFPTSRPDGCSRPICENCALHLPRRVLMDDGNALPFDGQPMEYWMWDSVDICPGHRPFTFQAGDRLIFVVNAKDTRFGEMIDRTSPLGNPFPVVHDTPAERERLIGLHKRHLWTQMQDPDSKESIELIRLAQIALERDLVLVCHCNPKPCHGQTVAKALVWLIGKGLAHNPGQKIAL